MEEMRLRYAQAKKKLREKQEREKAERRRAMLDQRRAEVAVTLGDSAELPRGMFAHLT